MTADEEGARDFRQMMDAEDKSAAGFYDEREGGDYLSDAQVEDIAAALAKLHYARDCFEDLGAREREAWYSLVAEAKTLLDNAREINARPEPCPGIEVEPGVFSGCGAAETRAKDCPTCGYPACVWDAVEGAAAAFRENAVVPWRSPEEEAEFKQHLADLVWERVTSSGRETTGAPTWSSGIPTPLPDEPITIQSQPDFSEPTKPRSYDAGERAATQQLHFAGVMWTRRPYDDAWTTDAGDVLHDIDYLIRVAKEGRQDQVATERLDDDLREHLSQVLTRYQIPAEVGIGTDSEIDRVEWALTRLKGFELESRHRERTQVTRKDADLQQAIMIADRLRRDHNGIMTVSLHLGHDGDNTVLLRAYDTPAGEVVLGKGCSGASLLAAMEAAEKDWRRRGIRERVPEMLADAVERFGTDPHAPEDNAPIFNTAGFEIAAFTLGWDLTTAEVEELLAGHPRVVRLAGGAHWYLLPQDRYEAGGVGE